MLDWKMTGARTGVKGAQEKSPQKLRLLLRPPGNSPSPSSLARPCALRWLPALGPSQTNAQQPGDARVMEHRGPEPRGADAGEKPISGQRPPPRAGPPRPPRHRRAPRPRARWPRGSRAGDSVSLLSNRTQAHLAGAPASWLSSDSPRRAGGGGCRLRSWLGPPGPPPPPPAAPTLRPGPPLPTHSPGPRAPGATPPPARSAPSAPLPRGPLRPLPPSAPRRCQPGRGEERRTWRGGFRFRSHLHLGPRG